MSSTAKLFCPGRKESGYPGSEGATTVKRSVRSGMSRRNSTTDTGQPYYFTDAPETGGGPLRTVIVFRLRPVGKILRRQLTAGAQRCDSRACPLIPESSACRFSLVSGGGVVPSPMVS